jgi:prepilin-type N-terminal cleavage/methylation domain-containing protein
MTLKHKGFTLVEMAVVLVIISLILGTVLGLGNAQIQASKINSTKQKQLAIKLALISFISRNNRLPCPAVATIAKGATGYGVEAPTGCTGTNLSGAVATGIVPWSTLGVTDENASDGYYNRFSYLVAVDATKTTEQTIVGLKGAISTHIASPAVPRSAPTGNQSNDCQVGTSLYNPCAAVVVILSHGVNGNGAYNENGVRKALPTGEDEAENTNDDSKFVVKENSDNQDNPYDDIVLPLSTTDLLTPLTTNGSIKDVSASINEDVTNIKNAIIANAVAYRVNTSGNYSYPIANTLPVLPAKTTSDAWGTPYQYVQIVPSITSATNSSLTAFTITSLGADEALNTSDDFLTRISVNDLQDAFAKAGW